MKPRKTKDIKAVLLKKGFEINPKKNDHEYYYLVIHGKKQIIHTYFSHGKKEYDKTLLSLVKRQLKFNNQEQFDDFLDCPMSFDDYIQMLYENSHISQEQ